MKNLAPHTDLDPFAYNDADSIGYGVNFDTEPKPKDEIAPLEGNTTLDITTGSADITQDLRVATTEALFSSEHFGDIFEEQSAPVPRLCDRQEVRRKFFDYAGYDLQVYIDPSVTQAGQAALIEITQFCRSCPAKLLAQMGIQHLCVTNNASAPHQYSANNTFLVNLSDSTHDLQLYLLNLMLEKSPPNSLIWPVCSGNPEMASGYKLVKLKIADNLKLTPADKEKFLVIHNLIPTTRPVVLAKSSRGLPTTNSTKEVVMDLDETDEIKQVTQIMDQMRKLDEHERDQSLKPSKSRGVPLSPAQAEILLNKDSKIHGVKVVLQSEDLRKGSNYITEQEAQNLKSVLDKYGKQLRNVGIEKVLLTTEKAGNQSQYPSNHLTISPTQDPAEIETIITKTIQGNSEKWTWKTSNPGKESNLIIDCSKGQNPLTASQQKAIFEALNLHANLLPPSVKKIIFTDDPSKVAPLPKSQAMQAKFFDNIEQTGTLWVDRSFENIGSDLGKICSAYEEVVTTKPPKKSGFFDKIKRAGSSLGNSVKSFFS